MKYLKKEKLYELAKRYIGEDMPKMKDCYYNFSNRSEMLSFTGVYSYAYYEVFFQSCGGCLSIMKKNDSVIFDAFYFDDFYAEGNPDKGYDYHSHIELSRRRDD